MKLGLILKITSDGENEILSCNKEEKWARYVSDSRSAIRELDNFDGTSKIICLVKFLGVEGYLLSVIKARSEGCGRGGDNVTALIFVPTCINITGNEVKNIVNIVKETISASSEIDENSLKSLFDREYPEKNISKDNLTYITSDTTNQYAIRYYGGLYSLGEMLGDYAMQNEYSEYKGIFLSDKNDNIKLKNGNEIPERSPILKTIMVGLEKKIEGYNVMYKKSSDSNFKSYEEPFEVYENEKIIVELKKDGYETINREVTITDSFDFKSIVKIDKKDRKIILYPSFFSIRDTYGNEIGNCSIKIDGRPLGNEGLSLNEDITDVKVKIECSRFETHEQKYTLKEIGAIEKPLKVVLKYKEFTNTYNLGDAKITIITKGSDENPLRGYYIQGKSLIREEERRPSVKKESKKKEMIISFVAGFLLAVFLAAAVAACYFFFLSSKSTSPSSNAKVENEKAQSEHVNDNNVIINEKKEEQMTPNETSAGVDDPIQQKTVKVQKASEIRSFESPNNQAPSQKSVVNKNGARGEIED